MDHSRWPSAGRVLAVMSVVPVVAVAGWLLAGVPLLLLGWFHPVPAILLGAGLTFLLGRYGLRRLPETVEATGWHTAAVVGVAAASAMFNGILHTEQLIVRRDPATYAQYAVWLAEHGSLPIPFDLAAFGGPDPALRFDSMGFYQYDGAVVPQFMPGMPLIGAFGHWLGGLAGVLLMPPVLGGLAVLAFAGVVARLVGARWAVLAALVFAVSMPLIYTSRSLFSEPSAVILLFGGVSLLLDARYRLRSGALGVGFLPAASAPMLAEAADQTARGELRSRPAGSVLMRALPLACAAHPGDTPASGRGLVGSPVVRALGWVRAVRSGDAAASAALAGLVFGLALAVRIDGLRDLLPVLAYAGLLIALRRHQVRHRAGDGVSDGRLGRPLLAGLAVGAGVGSLAAYLLARPYLAYLSGSLKPLLVICAAVLALTIAGTVLAPRLGARIARLVRRPSRRTARLLPALAAGLVVLAMAGFAARPWAQTVRRAPLTPQDVLTADFIAKTQAANHLPSDPGRLYYEDSLYWVFWYVGVPIAVLATLAAAVLARRLVRERDFVWLLPLAVIGWTTVTTLWLPSITPDHPWASRRLVPVVLPGLILLAAWGLRWVRNRAWRMGYGRRAQRALLAAGCLLLVAPAAVTSIGTAFTPVERGEAAAVAGLCAALPRDASVLIVERVTGDRFTQLVRGMCGLPTARVVLTPGTHLPSPANVTRLADRVRRAGRAPVLLAAQADQVSPYGAPVQVMRLRTGQDERSLTDPPNGTWSLSVDVWMTLP
ncbi:hypothetical protein [Nonomuraea basaltis]|uniref:hypothetical protein n=1 Tax=Nonomuraea basaltis TaxID=2495887 RepID=UPI00110C5C22|nr:hypothetical protein [Nonomuraea basaltis]TMR92730.1 hypothetical protein EJK15_43080 [Nonomuraea basaltis]